MYKCLLLYFNYVIKIVLEITTCKKIVTDHSVKLLVITVRYFSVIKPVVSISAWKIEHCSV